MMTEEVVARAGRIRRTLLLLLAVSVAGSCASVVSAYDEHVDAAATTLQKRMDAFLTSIGATAGTPEGAFATREPFYDAYRVELRAVRVRAEASTGNAITVEQLDLMVASLAELERVLTDALPS